MRNDPIWFDLLCCPACKGALILKDVSDTAADGHIITGTLRCQQCSSVYPIVRGVPRFIPSTIEEDVTRTVEGFGFEWQNANPLVQESSFIGPEIFLDFIYPVLPDFFKGKVVLDGGCGLGRDVLLAHRFGAQAVVGVDLSEAVEAAFENTRSLPETLIIQADLFKLPLRRQFDYAYSVGVLHHTPDPRGAFAAVTKLVKPGGSISAWVYGRENNGWIIHILNPIREKITSKLPRRLLWLFAYLIAAPMYVVLNAIYLPVNRHKSLSFMRSFLFYFDYLCWLGQHCDFKGQALVVFDHLVPTIAEYIAKPEFSQWFEENQLEEIVISSRAGNSWRGFGKKPSRELPAEAAVDHG